MSLAATPTNQELLADLLSSVLGAPSAWLPSRQLQHLRHTVATSNDVTELGNVLEVPTLRLATPAATVAARDELAGGALPSARVRSQLDAGLAELERHTLRAERVGAATLAGRALQRSGFSVRQGSSDDVTAIEARRGHAVMLVAVNPGGVMAIDWAGHDGDDCEAAMAEVREAFAAEGLEVTVRRQTRHRIVSGGSLITRAANAGRGDLVAGVLADHAAVDANPSTEGGAVRERPRHQAR